jgi:adenine deaminase
MAESFSVKGNYVDVRKGLIYPAKLSVEQGLIKSIERIEEVCDAFIMPGFIDAHVHVESSMLLPSEFARLAVCHGTVATISDPHEIGNVLGVEGVKYMIDNGKKVPFHFYFGAPSCVPATRFETAGAVIDPAGVEELLQMDEVRYLAEVMNFPGVLNGDTDMMAKIAIAKKYGKVIDGHAPGLRGELAKQYIDAGITTDHECFTAEEALDKLKHGMKILIREGSAAKNFDALIPLFPEFSAQMMFCSDDKHPNDLVRGHIDLLAQRAVAKGNDPMAVIRACSMNVVDHYGLDVGLLQEGDSADFICVRDLTNFEVLATYIRGEKVAQGGVSNINRVEEKVLNRFHSRELTIDELRVEAQGPSHQVIVVEDGQLITKSALRDIEDTESPLESDIEQDVLKIVVVNRYASAKPAIAFVKNFGLKKGAIASTVAHDSHNIIAVGVKDEDILCSINILMDSKGGVCLVDEGQQMNLDLPVAGLMSDQDGYAVAEAYEAIDQSAKDLGSQLASPFMTLSFCALLVIPELKLSDKGLFDGEKFELVGLFDQGHQATPRS